MEEKELTEDLGEDLELDIKDKRLTPQQVLFVKAYTTRGDTFCNATRSYILAYDYVVPVKEDGDYDTQSPQYKSVPGNARRLLMKPYIRKAVEDELLERFTDRSADSRLQEIIEGGRDSDSVQAIKIYNDLKKRIVKRLDVSVENRPLVNLSDAELEEMIK